MKRFYFYIKYRLLFDIRYGEGRWGRMYAQIGQRFNPLRPRYWKRNKPPVVDLPGGYKKIVPLAYNTGDGWWLHWGALYDGDDSNVWDLMYPEPLCDVTDIEDRNDYTIEEWPFFYPVCDIQGFRKSWLLSRIKERNEMTTETKVNETKQNKAGQNGIKPTESDLNQIETNSSVDFPIDFVFREFLSQHTDGGELVKAAMKDDGKVLRVETRKVKAIK